jgi:predicted small metal-binding protein
MAISIGCKELGVDCGFVTKGESKEVVVDSLIRHTQEEHGADWFILEEIYLAAWSVIQEKSA